MGLSGGKKEPKPDPAKNMAAIEAVNKVSPLQAIIDARAKKFFDWEDSAGEYAGHAKDVTEAPGYDNLLDIYGNAEAIAAKKKIGNPNNAFSEGAHPGFSEQLEKQNEMERYNTRASGLSEGLTGLRNQAHGLAGQSIESDAQRKRDYAALLGANTRDYYNRPKQPSLWERIAGYALGGI